MKSVSLIVVAFVSGVLVATIFYGYTGGSRLDTQQVTTNIAPAPEKTDIAPAPEKPSPMNPSVAEVQPEAPLTRDKLLDRAERQFRNGEQQEVEQTFLALDELEADEADARIAAEMDYFHRSGLVAAGCGLAPIAKARLLRCLKSYGQTSSRTTDAMSDRLRLCYEQAAHSLLSIASEAEADQFEFWFFARDYLEMVIPDSARRAHFTLPGMTEQYNRAILILRTVRMNTTDEELQTSIDRAIAAVENRRQQWLQSSKPKVKSSD